MKKFIKRTCFYVFIGLLYVAVGEFFLWKLGESVSIEKVTDLQTAGKKELYYGRRILGNSLNTYKFTMFRKRNAKVLVLGQSVTLQFRDFMFAPFQNQFYNAGLMARNVDDLEYVITLFENGEQVKPELIVLGLDFSFVLENNELDKTYSLQMLPEDRATNIESHFNGMQKVFLVGTNRNIPKVNVGFGKAGMVGRGYRNDGSYRHKPEIENYIKTGEYIDGELSEKLQKRVSPFVPPMRFSQEKADRFRAILSRLSALQIDVLLYVPPFSDAFYNKAQKDEMFHPFFTDFLAFQNKLVQEGHNLIPFTTPSKMSLNDAYMVDADHPGEVLCAIQLLEFLSNSATQSKMLQAIDLNNLEELVHGKQHIPISFLRDSISLHLQKPMAN